MNTYNIVCKEPVDRAKLIQHLETLSEYLLKGAFVVQAGDQITFHLKDEENGIVLNIEDEMAPECGWVKFDEIINAGGDEPDIVKVNTGNVIEWGAYGHTALIGWVQNYTVEDLAKYFNGTVDYGNGAREPKHIPPTYLQYYRSGSDIDQQYDSLQFWSFDVPRFGNHAYWKPMIDELKLHIPKPSHL